MYVVSVYKTPRTLLGSNTDNRVVLLTTIYEKVLGKKRITSVEFVKLVKNFF